MFLTNFSLSSDIFDIRFLFTTYYELFGGIIGYAIDASNCFQYLRMKGLSRPIDPFRS